jgi:hypothetical protein
MSQFMDLMRLPNSGLGIAKGQFADISHRHRFGAVPAMSQNTTGTVWDVNDTVYPWASWNTAGTLSIPAVNEADDGKTVTIVGLDEDYVILTETVTISSDAAVTTTGEFKRVESAYMHNGSATNLGAILIQKSAVTVAKISAGKGQSLMAIYTVPAGYTGYILKGTCTCQAGADATGDMYVRLFGEASFNAGHSFEVSGTGGEYTYDFAIPVKIPEKSDIDVRATVRSNNARVTAAFDILLDYD